MAKKRQKKLTLRQLVDALNRVMYQNQNGEKMTVSFDTEDALDDVLIRTSTERRNHVEILGRRNAR